MPSREVDLGKLERAEDGHFSVQVGHPELGQIAIKTFEVEETPEAEGYVEGVVEFLKRPEFLVYYRNNTAQDWEWHLTNRSVVTALVEDASLVREGQIQIGDHYPTSRIPMGLVSIFFQNGRPVDVGFTP